MIASVAAKDENEKRALGDLAGMWVKAATVSDKIFTSPLSQRAGVEPSKPLPATPSADCHREHA
jgi:hypothetical protein